MPLRDFTLRDATVADAEQIVSLNADSVAVTSPMDTDRFRHLFGLCSIVTVAEMDGRAVAFLMAMTDSVDYDNANYRWFRERLKRFVYVDRVVVSPDARGLGIGSALYSQVQSWAIDATLFWLVAEMDIDPPNVGSLSFHKSEGFAQLGTRVLDNGKTVSMQMRQI